MKQSGVLALFSLDECDTDRAFTFGAGTMWGEASRVVNMLLTPIVGGFPGGGNRYCGDERG